MFMKVDLPDPDGPMIGDELARLDDESDIAQHRHWAGGGLVLLAQALGANQRFQAHQNSLERKVLGLVSAPAAGPPTTI